MLEIPRQPVLLQVLVQHPVAELGSAQADEHRRGKVRSNEISRNSLTVRFVVVAYDSHPYEESVVFTSDANCGFNNLRPASYLEATIGRELQRCADAARRRFTNENPPTQQWRRDIPGANRTGGKQQA